MKNVSSGRLPYQITRNCDHMRYAQNTLKPKHSFPRSCCCLAENSPSRPMRRRTASTSTASAINAARKLPMKRSEEHTSELQSRSDLVCRLLLEKKKWIPRLRGSSHTH